jgi:hypothetical protein
VDKSWLIDYRIFDPDIDGLKKIEQAMEMYKNVVHSKELIHQYVLFDAAYATKKIMALVEKYNHYFLCNIKSNRLVTEYCLI